MCMHGRALPDMIMPIMTALSYSILIVACLEVASWRGVEVVVVVGRSAVLAAAPVVGPRAVVGRCAVVLGRCAVLAAEGRRWLA